MIYYTKTNIFEFFDAMPLNHWVAHDFDDVFYTVEPRLDLNDIFEVIPHVVRLQFDEKRRRFRLNISQYSNVAEVYTGTSEVAYSYVYPELRHRQYIHNQVYSNMYCYDDDTLNMFISFLNKKIAKDFVMEAEEEEE